MAKINKPTMEEMYNIVRETFHDFAVPASVEEFEKCVKGDQYYYRYGKDTEFVKIYFEKYDCYMGTGAHMKAFKDDTNIRSLGVEYQRLMAKCNKDNKEYLNGLLDTLTREKLFKVHNFEKCHNETDRQRVKDDMKAKITKSIKAYNQVVSYVFDEPVGKSSKKQETNPLKINRRIYQQANGEKVKDN